MSTKRNIQPFFPHSANSRNEDNLIRLRIAHGAAGYGIYYMLMERLRQSDNYECDLDYDVLAFDLREDQKLIKSVICDFDLFEFSVKDHGGKFHNKELTQQMAAMEEKRQRRQEAARKAAAARWESVRRVEAEKLGIPYEEYKERFVKPEYMDESASDVEDKIIESADTSVNETIVDEALVSTLDKEIHGMMKDSEWTEAVMKQFNLASEFELADMFKKFLLSCKCEGKKGHKDLKDAQSHFSRWMMKCRKKSGYVESVEKEKKTASDKAFLKATAESNRKMEEERRKREQEAAEEAKRKLALRLKIIEMGYDPDKHKIGDVMNPRWREKNPPEKLKKSQQ